jgi:hypothetical protein
MNQYGGTPIAYAASFCMRRAVATYLSLAKDNKVRGSIDLNAPDQLCVKSGFSPMHAAVCNGFASMYDFLVDLPELGLNETLKGDEKLKSGIGNVPECLARYGSGLTPLQLACQLGLHDVFDHIMRRPTYSSILWKWGPVTQFRINLNGIDSASGQGGEVLELIGRFDAKVVTQEMLLDEFREGFLHKLFEEKWERFGQRMWVVHRLLDLVYLVPLVTNALWLKEAPVVALQQTWLPICTLLTMGPCLEEDVRSAIMWWSGYQGPPSDKLAQFSIWASSHMVTTKVIGCALTAVACIALIMGYKPAGITEEMVWGPDLDQSGRLLQGAAGAAVSKAGTSGEDDQESAGAAAADADAERAAQAAWATFGKYDLDGGGTIDRKELQLALADLGLEVTNEELSTLLSKFGREGDLDMDTFATLVIGLNRHRQAAHAAAEAAAQAAAEAAAQAALVAAATLSASFAATLAASIASSSDNLPSSLASTPVPWTPVP